uniref:Uncharacterized protein n=1 Tax=Anguilla anguilla TaxID=7936 RepID=A0A0E9QZ02_ANGAN
MSYTYGTFFLKTKKMQFIRIIMQELGSSVTFGLETDRPVVLEVSTRCFYT